MNSPETEAHAESPVFDAAMRDHGLVHFPRPLGTLTPARIEPMPPLTVASVRDQYESQRAAGFAQGGAL